MLQSLLSSFTDHNRKEGRTSDSNESQESSNRVLVVDDDRVICVILDKILSPLGIQVETTTNPIVASELLSGISYNVVLLEIQMPEKSGIELLPEIGEITPTQKQ